MIAKNVKSNSIASDDSKGWQTTTTRKNNNDQGGYRDGNNYHRRNRDYNNYHRNVKGLMSIREAMIIMVATTIGGVLAISQTAVVNIRK